MTIRKVLGRAESQIGLALALGLVIGFASNSSYLAFILGGVIIVPLTWFCIRYPPTVVAVFWMAYALQTTVFGGQSVTGLYYPLYALLAVNGIIRVWRIRDTIFSWRILLPYLAFIGLALLSLTWQPAGLSVDSGQRLFIFCLGLLTALQLRTDRDVQFVMKGMELISILVSSWVIGQAVSTGFAYRAGVNINPNYVATVIDIGLIALLNQFFDAGRVGRWTGRVALLAAVALESYANLLLGSRGVTAAVIIAAVALAWMRIKGFWQRLGAVLVCSLVAALLLVLPGAQGLSVRFSEANTNTLNDRLPLWKNGLSYMSEVGPAKLVMGSGMGFSEVITREVVPGLTSMHNEFLQLLVEYGVIGFVLFFSLIAAAWRKIRLDRTDSASVLQSMLLFWLVAFMTATSADNFVFWIVMGCSLARTSTESISVHGLGKTEVA